MQLTESAHETRAQTLLFCQPRTFYGADYYSVKQNKHGYNHILGIIDLATGNLVLRAVKGRNAHNTAHTLFYDIVVCKGVPLRFHSDAVKEFLSTTMHVHVVNHVGSAKE